MKTFKILTLAMLIGLLITTVNAQEVDGILNCTEEGGYIIAVHSDAYGTDIDECRANGSVIALFHCCDHADCVVDNYPGSTSGPPYCHTDPNSNFSGYACCSGEMQEPTTTTTTIKKTTTTVRSGGGGGGGGGGTVIGYLTEKKPTCYDGIKNCHDDACEEDVDCGGPCDPCPTCTDGIQNQGEEAVDCGGPCKPCPTTTTTKPTTTTTSTTSTSIATTTPATTIKETTTIADTGTTGALIGLMPEGALLGLFLLLLLLLFLMTKRKKKEEETAEE